MEKIKITPRLMFELWRGISRGKSINRVMRDRQFRDISLSGKGLDLGAGSEKPSYNCYLRTKGSYSITHTDYYKEGDGLIKLDLEKPFGNIDDKAYDFIICVSVLEHIYDWENVLLEAYRILRAGGLFVGSTPFLHQYHPDPYDYHRFTHAALIKMFSDTGFKLDRMVYLGFGPLTAGISQFEAMLPAIIRIPLVTTAISADWLMGKLVKTPIDRFAMNYFYIFRKPL